MADTAMPNNAAAIWSAVAALFAALSSFLIMLIQRRNLLESARPELVLTGWSRKPRGQDAGEHEVISFQTIKNVGRGAALHVILDSHQQAAERPTAILSTTRLAILASNEASEVNGEILIWWKNVAADHKGFKHLPITVTALCWDSRGMRHETRYSLLAVELGGNVGVADAIAPGVMLGSRTTTTRPVWLLKLSSQLRRVPLLGRLFRTRSGS